MLNGERLDRTVTRSEQVYLLVWGERVHSTSDEEASCSVLFMQAILKG
jgi:hypothetical protein